MAVTIRDVARRANVSIKTVSRVINHHPYVADDTRLRVLDAIDELGYVTNVSARRLSSGKAYTIGLIFHDASWHYVNHVLEHVLAASLENDYSTILQSCDTSSQASCNAVLDLSLQRQVDGFIFTPPSDNAVILLDALDKNDIPYIRLTPFDLEKDAPYVTASDWQGAYDMGKHLLSLGHTRIGYIQGPQHQRAGRERFSGFISALEEHDIKLPADLIEQGKDIFSSGKECGKRLLNKHLRPTAIFTNNDEMAAGVLAAAGEQGLRVPEDLSVAGFDDVPLARQVWPPLTTVHQPIEEMAQTAVQLLIDLLQGKEIASRRVQIPTELIIRASTEAVGKQT